MIILADIGGTFARFALHSEHGLEHVKKYKAQDFENFHDALVQYCADHSLNKNGSIRIATAAYEDGSVWKFVNQNKWTIDPAALNENGWIVDVILNDFEAATWALMNLECGDIQTLKGGNSKESTRCLIGPGTGLGLGYLHEKNGEHFVQNTHGGHMPVSPVTQEQWNIVQAVQRLKNDGHVAVFENFVSGPGLYNIYTALCDEAKTEKAAQSVEALLDHLDEQPVKDAIRIFHEFFGLYAATVTVTGHAYGGLYLTGGVLEHLIEADVFDFEYFEKWFCLNGVESVADALKATPIVHITYLYPALKGLMNA